MNQGYKILVVDDDPMNQDILDEILGEKYLITTADNGEEALDMLPKLKPDLILLDIMMPGIDGYEVCRRVRGDSRFQFIKIVLVSGKAMIQERLKGYEAGADDYITKPFVEEELEAKVDVFIRLKRKEEVDTLKNDLLKLFSEETTTPLHTIISLSELHREDEFWTEQLTDDLSQIAESGNRLLDLVRKTSLICDLKGKSDLHLAEVDMLELMDSTVDKYRNLAEKRNIHFDLSGDSFAINGDRKLLERAMEYLVDNAVKYSRDNGAIEIRVENLNITIRDYGVGIDSDKIDKIFDEFATKDFLSPKGQGLSLPIVRHIVERHQGTIEVESTKGEGAAFTIRFK